MAGFVSETWILAVCAVAAGMTGLVWRRRWRDSGCLLAVALAYNLGTYLRTLALPDAVEQWSLTGPREKLIKVGAKIVRHGRYVTFQMVEVAIPLDLFADTLRRIDRLRPNMAQA